MGPDAARWESAAMRSAPLTPHRITAPVTVNVRSAIGATIPA